jgi:hypothetical protein
MATSSNPPTFNTLSHTVHEKLTRDNFRLWKAQVWPVVHDAQVTEFLDGTKKAPEEFIVVEKQKTREKVPNPEFVTWLIHD